MCQGLRKLLVAGIMGSDRRHHFVFASRVCLVHMASSGFFVSKGLGTIGSGRAQAACLSDILSLLSAYNGRQFSHLLVSEHQEKRERLNHPNQ